MRDLNDLIIDIIENKKLIYGVFSNLRYKNTEYNKVSIKPVKIKDKLMIQFEYSYDKKVIHENLTSEEGINKSLNLIKEIFKQVVFYTIEADYQILISKKEKIKIIKNKATRSKKNLNHDKKKNYIIEENTQCSFLTRLGVMNEDGKVYKKKYDKFRQINKFLEIVADTLRGVEIEDDFKIVDFGCGKSYLTFALYYYLVDILGIKVKIIGLDLKEDVINFCNGVACDLKYDDLKFIHGDIVDYEELDNVDMVVTLHACDTATDAALAKAVNWKAKVILSVPCCQHEIFNKIDNNTLKPMLKHGLIKERISSLATDSIRANVLEILGYTTNLMEFIDITHTPKNILIRAIKTNNVREEVVEEYLNFKKFFNLKNLYIEEVMKDKLSKIIKAT